MNAKDVKRYIEVRKKLIRELKHWTYERYIANKKLRKIRNDMENWDRALLLGDQK